MAINSRIEWTDATWNPVTGCTKISAGCEHCYAERMAKRLAGRAGYPADDPFRVTIREERLKEPSLWSKPRMCFVCSMADLFHRNVPVRFIDEVITTMVDYWWHTYQILTKRAERMAEYLNGLFPYGLPDQMWCGVSAENQEMLDSRITHLASIMSKVRFLSIEPMLGPVDLQALHSTRIDWVIVGGETGPGARPLNPAWVRAVRDECASCGVPFFFKSWGEWTTEMPQGVSLANRQMTYQHGVTFYRMGKRWAGRELDGETWDGYPSR